MTFKPGISDKAAHSPSLLSRKTDNTSFSYLSYKDRIVSKAAQERICLPKEKDLDPLLVFTRKECAMKLTGLGFSLPMRSIDTTSVYEWNGLEYRFFSIEQEGYLISILTAEGSLHIIQLLTPEELL